MADKPLASLIDPSKIHAYEFTPKGFSPSAVTTSAVPTPPVPTPPVPTPPVPTPPVPTPPVPTLPPPTTSTSSLAYKGVEFKYSNFSSGSTTSNGTSSNQQNSTNTDSGKTSLVPETNVQTNAVTIALEPVTEGKSNKDNLEFQFGDHTPVRVGNDSVIPTGPHPSDSTQSNFSEVIALTEDSTNSDCASATSVDAEDSNKKSTSDIEVAPEITEKAEEESDKNMEDGESTPQTPLSDPEVGDNSPTTLSLNTSAGGGYKKRMSIEVPSSPRDNGPRSAPAKLGPDKWERGGNSGGPTINELLSRKDNITRYNKTDLLALFDKPRSFPEEFSDIKLMKTGEGRIRECRQGPKGWKEAKAKKDKEPHEDEKKIFSENKDGVFRYQPSRLTDTTDPETILRLANAILNKMTPTTFDKLCEEFMKVGIDDEILMDRAVDMIITKAQSEEQNSHMYAALSMKMTREWSAGASSEDEKNLGNIFRVKLLEKCEEEFQKDRAKALEDIMSLDIPPEDKEIKEISLKKRFRGHMRFIGELYQFEQIKPKIMFTCVDELLKDSEEQTISCMCELFKTIGAKLEAYVAETKTSKKYKTKYQSFFENIEELATRHPTSRARFMCRDLIDMKNSGWQQRIKVEKAKKLTEFREDPPSSPRSASGSQSSTPRLGSGDARNLASQSGDSIDAWVQVSAKKSKTPTGPAPPNTFSSKSSGNTKTVGAVNSKGKGKDFGGKDSPKSSGLKESKSSKGPIVNNTRGSSSKSSQVSSSNIKSTSNSSLADVSEESGAVATGIPSNLIGADGEVPKEVLQKKMRSTIEEFFVNDLFSEAVLVIRETIHPNGMPIVVKYWINLVCENHHAQQIKLCQLLVQLHTDPESSSNDSYPLLTTETLSQGFQLFFREFDDLICDVPKLGTYGANILANLVNSKVIPLSILGNIDKDACSTFIFHLPGFIARTVEALVKLTDEENAKIVYKASGIDLEQAVVDADGMDTLEVLMEKHSISFLK